MLFVSYVPWLRLQTFSLIYPDNLTCSLVTAGLKFIHFWEVVEANIIFRDGDWKEFEPQTILEAISFQNYIVTGTTEGNMLVWDNCVCISVKPAHAGSINKVVKAPKGNIFVSAGKEGTVKVWDEEITVIQTFNLR